MLDSIWPVTIALLSTPTTRVPPSVSLLEPFSATVYGSGTLPAAAFVASSPYVALLPLPACDTTDLDVVISLAGTRHYLVVASTNMRCSQEPARRSGSLFVGIAREPPALCRPYSVGLIGA